MNAGNIEIRQGVRIHAVPEPGETTESLQARLRAAGYDVVKVEDDGRVLIHKEGFTLDDAQAEASNG